jgi:hypothetical protein
MAVALSRLSVKTFCDCEPQFDDDLVTLVSQVGKPPLLRQKPRIARNRVICEDAAMVADLVMEPLDIALE